MLNVAFIGLGAIGRPMAARVSAAGFPLVVWNRTPARAASFAAATGAVHASSPAHAVREANVIITSLATSDDVTTVLDGEEGLLAGAQPGAVLVDCTSGDPATSREIAQRLAAVRVGFLDAPVSGGVRGAEEGKLTVMCGGEARDIEYARPVIETFAERIVHCGPVGAGDAVKAMNQALLALTIWGTGEALVALSKAGVSAQVALDVINSSSGRSNASMNLFPERVLTRTFPRTFRMALLHKDVRIAADIARAERVPAPLMQLIVELCNIAHRQLGESADHVEAVQVIERWAGTEIE